MLRILSKEEIKSLEMQGKIAFISLWDTIEKAKDYYDTLTHRYYAYQQDPTELTHAFSTPVKVYKLIE
ncbi:hypothetical protein O3V59_22645 [Brevibacillus thermoruber]|uniref:Uncharacterized protein n=1 Tax=Brevibacillus thermoruber TaxID=33942 RepID=A0A9X3TVI7_9BACL|nr:hypothetical protein [Brevibacillus thermoruber]MDA5111130.1 hypothetical protein [Brevibacillus thermoruber]